MATPELIRLLEQVRELLRYLEPQQLDDAVFHLRLKVDRVIETLRS